MAKKKETPMEGTRFFETLRKVLLASVGAMALATDEAEELINRLVERGQIAQEEGRKLAKEMMAKSRERMETSREKIEASLDARIEKALERLNVPTKAEIESLSKSIDELSKKIDKLAKKA